MFLGLTQIETAQGFGFGHRGAALDDFGHHVDLGHHYCPTPIHSALSTVPGTRPPKPLESQYTIPIEVITGVAPAVPHGV
jgi:hypothetical protein